MIDKHVTKEAIEIEVAPGSVGKDAQAVQAFPFDAFEFDRPSVDTPKIKLRSPWNFELAGTGRTTETVKANADAIAAIGPTWKKFTDPATGWLATKTTGWTADSFSGGLEVDFTAVVPAGTKAVLVVIRSLTAAGDTFHRKSGDTNISNTPNASGEHSHRAVIYVGSIYAADIIDVWLSTEYKAQFAVTDINQDIYIAYPIEYLL